MPLEAPNGYGFIRWNWAQDVLQKYFLQVYVALASGKRKELSIAQSSKVGDLRLLAQRSLEQAPLKLVSAAGRVLSDPAETLKDTGL